MNGTRMSYQIEKEGEQENLSSDLKKKAASTAMKKNQNITKRYGNTIKRILTTISAAAVVMVQRWHSSSSKHAFGSDSRIVLYQSQRFESTEDCVPWIYFAAKPYYYLYRSSHHPQCLGIAAVQKLASTLWLVHVDERNNSRWMKDIWGSSLVVYKLFISWCLRQEMWV